MDQNKVADYLLLIKLQIASQETLRDYHLQVEAMVEMVLAKDLIDFSTRKLHNYLWALSDLVGKAKSLNQDLIGTLNNIAKLFVNED